MHLKILPAGDGEYDGDVGMDGAQVGEYDGDDGMDGAQVGGMEGEDGEEELMQTTSRVPGAKQYCFWSVSSSLTKSDSRYQVLQ